jgi:hypothetical protein
MSPNLRRRQARARKAFAFVCLLWFAAVLTLLFAFGCSGFAPGPFACELHGTYRVFAVGKVSSCRDWSADVQFAHQLSALCRVPLGLEGYRGEVDCDTEEGIVQSCLGELHNETCSYHLAVDRCEKGLCDD